MKAKEKQVIRDAMIQERVAAGLTRRELWRMIERRPDLYSRYESLLDKLPGRLGKLPSEKGVVH